MLGIAPQYFKEVRAFTRYYGTNFTLVNLNAYFQQEALQRMQLGFTGRTCCFSFYARFR